MANKQGQFNKFFFKFNLGPVKLSTNCENLLVSSHTICSDQNEENVWFSTKDVIIHTKLNKC